MAVEKDLILMFKFVRRLVEVAKEKDISKIRKMYGANKERIVDIALKTRIGKVIHFYFQVREEGLKWFPNYPGRVDLTLYTNTDTMLNLLDGHKKILDHASKKVVMAEYTPWDAYRLGDVYGDSGLSITDVKTFLDLFYNEIADWHKITGPIRAEKY